MKTINQYESVIDSLHPTNSWEKFVKKVCIINLNDAKRTGSEANKIACLSEIDFYLREIGIKA